MPQLIVTASVLNVRAGPGTTHRIRTQVVLGDEVESIGETTDGRWVRIRARRHDGTLDGWVSTKYVRAIDIGAKAPAVAAPEWLDAARREIGVKEYPGAQHNPRIQQYAKKTTLAAPADEVPWCSSFVNWCLAEAGIQGTRSAAARSWLDWGVDLKKPVTGCVTVFSRGSNPTSGHVAFYVASKGAFYDVLGGNQSNQVKVASYPSARRLGFRWPKGVALPAGAR